MAKDRIDPEVIRQKFNKLIDNFETDLAHNDLRTTVLSIIPFYHYLRGLGKSLIAKDVASSGRDRILFYFRKYPYIVIKGDEFLVISGVQEYARRIRELRVQSGWSIITGVTAKEMAKENEFPFENIDVAKMRPDDYLLLSEVEDRDAAHRWHIANSIRKRREGSREKILEFLRMNVGKSVTGEELRYVANGKSEWGRRTRELRTEYGWPVHTSKTARPDLPGGFYVLEADRQSPVHDRRIPDPVRNIVLRRDGYRCVNCGWTHELWNASDPRHLELHHVVEHAKGGENIPKNLITLCTICHDDAHRGS